MNIQRTIAPLLLASLAAPGVSWAQTNVPAGNLVGSQTWTPAGSPYVLAGDVTVPMGTTLTIQAGAEVRFNQGDSLGSGTDTTRAELRVSGTIAVQGTAQSPVTFTSGRAAPATSDYYGLILLAGSSANLAGLTARFGHRCVTDQTAGTVINNYVAENCGYGLEVQGGSPAIGGARISGSTGYGIYAHTNSNVVASALTIFNNASYGIYGSDAHLNISQSLLRANGSRGIYLRTTTGTYNSSFTRNTIYGNGTYGIYIFESAGTLNATIRDNMILNNGSYGVYSSGAPSLTVTYNFVFGHTTANYSSVTAGAGSVSENPLLVDAANGDFRPTSRSGARFAASDGGDIGAFPYDGALTPALTGHLYANTTLTAAASPHVVTGDLTVEPGVTLTIEPGAELRFAAGNDQMSAGDDSARTELRIEGALVADGTASLGVRFVSNGGTQAAGDWYGIRFVSGAAASIIDYATIRHARYGVHSSAPAGTVIQRSLLETNSSYGIYADAGALQLSQLVVRGNTSYGIYMTDAAGRLEYSRIFDNGSRGIYLRTTAGTHTVELVHNTILANGTYGIYIFESAGTQNVTVRDNLIFNNGSYGIYASGAPTIAATYNLVWGHSTANYSSVTAGAGSITENPLIADLNGRDLRITSNSPARRHASDGTDIGALVFDGAPTTGVQGHLYTETVWSGTVDVLGDVTVEPGVTLIISPGAIIRFAANTDSMLGSDTSDTELIVLGRLLADGTPQARIRLTSSNVTPAGGDWYGVRLFASSANSSIDNAIIEYARYNIHSQAPANVTVTQSELRFASSYGAYIDAGAIGLNAVLIRNNTSYGIYATDASPVLSNLIVHENGSRGLYLRSTSGTHTIAANQITVWSNGAYGVYIFESAAL